ncbi:MAG: glycoside-pentoside-hexuronide (GPH):cation symporter [Pseudomonadota bacterium]
MGVDAGTAEPALSARGRVGYGVGISGLWMVFMTVAFYLFYFYTDVFGLSPAQAGLVFFGATMWDAVSDPAMGWLASRTRTRWGQYRPYILIGAVPLCIAFVIMFSRPDWAAGHLVVYALGAQLMFRTAFTVVYIPYTALIARLSRNADERASIAGVKTFFVAAGSLTVSFFGLPLVDQLGRGDDLRGFFLTALLFGCLSIVTLTLCGLVTKETALSNSGAHSDTSSPIAALKALFTNPAFVLVFAGVIVFTGCYATLNKTLVYFFEYDIGDRSQVRWALSAVSVAGLVSPFVWAKLTHLTSKRVTWLAGCLLATAALLIFYIAAPRSAAVITAFYFIAGCGIQAFLMTFYAITADAIDYGEWLSGIRVEAIGFGLLSFANKTSLAIGGGLLGWLLGQVGYTAGAVQTPETIAGIRAILVFVPCAGFLASSAIIWFFPVSTARHNAVIEALNARRQLT